MRICSCGERRIGCRQALEENQQREDADECDQQASSHCQAPANSAANVAPDGSDRSTVRKLDG